MNGGSREPQPPQDARVSCDLTARYLFLPCFYCPAL
jgi:hypothetical protein